MSTCFNCRASVPATVERCPNCGVTYVRGTWRSSLSGLRPSPHGWGVSPAVMQSVGFRVTALLVPFWVPPVVALLVGGTPVALALLLAPFVFIPGVCAVANFTAWPRFARFCASLGYVAVTGVLGFAFVSWFIESVRGL